MTQKKGESLCSWIGTGLNPDDSANLGTLTFGGPLAVAPAGKLAITWGHLKKFAQ